MVKGGVYGIGNVLMDVIINVNDSELKELDIDKGVMHLVDEEQRDKILEHFKERSAELIPGGSCPNTIIAMAGLGIPTTLAGKVGSDDFGKSYLDKLEKLKVNSKVKTGDGKTGISIILVTEDTERTMNTDLGLCRELNEDDIDTDIVQQSEFLYFTGYMWDTEGQKAAVMKAIAAAEESGTKIIFDVADSFVVDRNKEEFLKLIEEHVYCVFANEDEAKMLFDTDDPTRAVTELADLCNMAVVKLGAKGALVKENGKDIITIPSKKVTAVDTTGAGDTFAAGFMFALHKDYSLHSCGLFASYLASQIVIQKGAQLSEEKLSSILKKIDNIEWLFDSKE